MKQPQPDLAGLVVLILLVWAITATACTMVSKLLEIIE